MKRWVLTALSASLLFLSCGWFEQPKPTWSEQVGDVIGDVGDLLERLQQQAQR